MCSWQCTCMFGYLSSEPQQLCESQVWHHGKETPQGQSLCLPFPLRHLEFGQRLPMEGLPTDPRVSGGMVFTEAPPGVSSFSLR